MAFITIKPLTTSNTAPTLTGYVDFERFDINGNPKQTISVYVNYTKYKLFDGNLGLDESKKPNQWKLHFSTPLKAGTYIVEAYVSDILTDTIIASDTKEAGLTITQPSQVQIQQQNPTILEKVAIVALLMGSLNKLFGGKNGIAPVPSVHPVLNDEASTALVGRGKEERAEDTMVKSKDTTRTTGVTKGNNVKNKVVDPLAAVAIPAANLDAAANALLGGPGAEMDAEIVKELNSAASPLDTINALNETARNTGNNPAGITGVYSPETGMSFGVGGLSG